MALCSTVDHYVESEKISLGCGGIMPEIHPLNGIIRVALIAAV